MDDVRYCYLYRDSKSAIRYIGVGEETRAESHTSKSHNPRLSELIDSGEYTLEVAGPYPAATAAAIEAALISALSVKVAPNLHNATPGNGPAFAPLGVPVRLAPRITQPALTLPELGRLCEGALAVRLSTGGGFNDKLREKFNPVHPVDQVVQENIARWWWLGPLVEQWSAGTAATPLVIVGLAGPPRRRYIAGALRIDGGALWTHNGADYEVPVRSGEGVDVNNLRGRLVVDARFGRLRQDHFVWVGADGRIRYPMPDDYQSKFASGARAAQET